MDAIAIGRLIVEGCGVWVGYRQFKGRRAAETELTEKDQASRSVQEYASPLTVGTLQRQVQVTVSGGAKWTETWTGIHSTEDVPNLQIPIDLRFWCPYVSVGDLRVRPIAGCPVGVRLVGQRRHQSEDDSLRINATVVVEGPLQAALDGLGFVLTLEGSKVYCATREELATAYAGDDMKAEYTSYAARFPANRLVLELEFPDAYRVIDVGVRPIAFYDRSEVQASSEQKALAEAFSFTDGLARIQLQRKPMPGVKYAISWTPPPAANLPQLKGA